MLISTKKSFSHLTFWLGSSLGLAGLSDFIHHKISAGGRKQVETPIYFRYLKDLFTEALLSERISLDSLTESTSKSIYISLTETMPQPPVEIKYPDRNFKVVWNRLRNGVLSKTTQNILYLTVHERTFTRQRGFRLLPNRYDSPFCQYCGLEETITHKYATCLKVSQSWDRLRDILNQLESFFIFESDHSIINLYFPKFMSENASIWLVGKYVELVGKEAILNGKIITGENLNGWLSAQLLSSKHQSMPNLGFIPGISRTGIG